MKFPIRSTTGPQTREAAVEVNRESRSVTFVASDETVDRYGDVIRVDGWDLKAFLANPVLLWGHNSKQPPIGQVSKLTIEGKQLLAVAEFLPEGVYDFADTVWKIVKEGALRAVSVGFMPTKAPNEIKDEKSNEWTGGYEWVGQELLELSVCPVPANPNALAIAKALNLDPRAVARIFPGTSAAEMVPAPNPALLRAKHTRLTLGP
jgi:HK97 family phage prohead protease